MKKNYYLIAIVLILNILIHSTSYALSNDFSFLLETMGIEEINQNGLKINEDIYNEYNLLVYGSPHDNYAGQRWKNVSTGHWSKNTGPWNGIGIRGEYWILGVNYNGKEVHNHLFPVDIEPPTAPIQWRYAIISDALESWQDAEKYMDDIQLEKARVENYATWKTKGSVYTQRYDINNKKWAANFLIPAMSADAELQSYAVFLKGTEYEISQENEKVEIPITYGAKVINLTEFAQKEHVKTIKSQLWINNILIDEIENTETLEIEKDIIHQVLKNDCLNSAMITLNIEIRSTLITKFTTDGPLVDIDKYTIFVNFNNFKSTDENTEYNHVIDENYAEYTTLPPTKITNIEIKKIVNGVEDDLLIAKKTGEKFICAGQTIVIEVTATNGPDSVSIEFEGDSSIFTLDSLTKRFEWTEPRSRGQKTFVSSLEKLNQMYSGKIFLKEDSYGINSVTYVGYYIIPYGTKQTLHSWSSLREITEEAFSIDANKLFSRINNPYQIVIKAYGSTGVDTERVNLDVFERWDTLYNRDITKYIQPQKKG